MANFGPYSNQSDGCWDSLWADNIHRMTDKEVKDSLDRKFKAASKELSNKTIHWFQDYLGITVQALFQGRRVPKQHLKRALWVVNTFLDYNITNWSDGPFGIAEEKISALKEEKQAIEDALKNRCRGKIRHTTGLLEQIDNFVGGSR